MNSDDVLGIKFDYFDFRISTNENGWLSERQFCL